MHACIDYINGNIYIHMIYVEVVSFSCFFTASIRHYLRMHAFVVIFIVSMTNSSRDPKHIWTKEEEATLVECLAELSSTGGWKLDNGMFRRGYLA